VAPTGATRQPVSKPAWAICWYLIWALASTSRGSVDSVQMIPFPFFRCGPATMSKARVRMFYFCASVGGTTSRLHGRVNATGSVPLRKGEAIFSSFQRLHCFRRVMPLKYFIKPSILAPNPDSAGGRAENDRRRRCMHPPPFNPEPADPASELNRASREPKTSTFGC
jgi:hypothetical protein